MLCFFFPTEVKGMEFLFSAGNNKANNVDFIRKEGANYRVQANTCNKCTLHRNVCNKALVLVGL